MDAVFFDMDGVVVDSEDYWVPLEREHIFAQAVAEEVDVEEITGMNVEDIHAHLDEHYTLQVDRDRFLALYDEVGERIYTEHAALMPGFDDVLAAARAHGPVALVTSSPRRWIGWVFDRFALADRSGTVERADAGPGNADRTFDAVASAEEVPRGKPAPDVYELAADRLGVDPADCLAIEDSTNGVRAARSAGTTVLAYGDPPEAARTEADGVVATSDALAEYLRSH